MTQAAKSLPQPEVYYDRTKQDYYVRNSSNRWISLNETSVKRYLRKHGHSADRSRGQELSDCDSTLTDIQLEKDVGYAAPLAGHAAGTYQMNEQRILVTESPKLITPVKGDWPLIDGILKGMLNDPIADQRPYLYGWLKIAIDAINKRKWQPGQVLALAGEIGGAKSLLQNIITVLLGGRSSKPYAFMSGTTPFNADLFRSEHLMIEDVAESVRIEKRRHFGAQIKAFAVNREQHCHGKHMSGLTLAPIWRVTISLNDVAERLLVLPPLDEDIIDKITLLKAHKKEMPMPTETPDEKSAFWQALMDELPAFVHFLNEWEIPKELVSPRFGILHYHHPQLTAGLKSLAPEEQLLEIVDAAVFYPKLDHHNPWKGSATALHAQLTESNGRCAKQAQALLYSATSCGMYLQRLEKRYPDRFKSRTVTGRSEYTIQPPLIDPEEAQS